MSLPDDLAENDLATMDPPTPIIDRIQDMPGIEDSASKVWGHHRVVPRDTDNGIEDSDWCYWGGDVVKGRDGTYHMFVARWPESDGHAGWKTTSRIARCTATNPLGPFEFQDDIVGDTYGHNPAVIEKDGTYAVFNYDRPTIADSEPEGYDIAYADSLEGPWEMTKVDIEDRAVWNNPAPVVRDDGSIVVINKNPHGIHIADSITGPYRSYGPMEFPKGFDYVEDYTIWQAGGLYHLIANQYGRKHGFYMYSTDALDWILPADFDAYVPGVTHYADGTETLWYKLERPQVVVEDGVATTLYLAALDVPKTDERGNDNHNSKTIALPLASPRGGQPDGPLGEGVYYVENSTSGLAITVDGVGDGASVILQPYEQAEAQRWLVTHLGDGTYRLEAMQEGTRREGNKVLAMETGNDIDGTTLVQEAWCGADTQHWNLFENPDGNYRLESTHNGDRLQLENELADSDDTLVLSSREDTCGQNWRFEPVTYGAFES